MREFHHSLDPAETLTVRRIFTFDRVPNKGNAVYCVKAWLRLSFWKTAGNSSASTAGTTSKSICVRLCVQSRFRSTSLSRTTMLSCVPPKE